MVTLSLLHISLPSSVLQAADFLGRGNGFLAMLMVGISLEFHVNRADIRDTANILILRFALGVAAALSIFFLIPAPLPMRQILAAAVFSATPTVSVVYCNKLHIQSSVPGLIVPLTTLLAFVFMPIVLLLVL
jgi:predicted permease